MEDPNQLVGYLEILKQLRIRNQQVGYLALQLQIRNQRVDYSEPLQLQIRNQRVDYSELKLQIKNKVDYYSANQLHKNLQINNKKVHHPGTLLQQLAQGSISEKLTINNLLAHCFKTDLKPLQNRNHLLHHLVTYSAMVVAAAAYSEVQQLSKLHLINQIALKPILRMMKKRLKAMVASSILVMQVALNPCSLHLRPIYSVVRQ